MEERMGFEDGVFAAFYDEAIKDEQETEKRGIPVFNEMVFINIKIPNSVDDVSRPATDADKRRFPQSWQAYQTGKEPIESGFPLEEWPQLTVSELKVCHAVGVKTVEQLANLADSGIHRLGVGGQTMKNRAQKFLTNAGEIDRLRQRVKELEDKIAKADKKAESRPEKKRKVVRVAAQ
jgi:hypothetical protein